MKRVLIIAYVFPPLGGGGVQRTLSFVQHLPAYGWQPMVVCADADEDYWAKDPTLLDRVSPDAHVERVSSGLVGASVRLTRRLLPTALRRVYDDRLLLPDRQIPWLPNALRRAAALDRPDVIFSTGPPWTDHVIAGLLARRHQVPWVADFRDPWTQNALFKPASSVHRRSMEALERWVYRNAAIVVANTATNASAIRADFPQTAGKVVHIPNGFDADVLDPLIGAASPPKRRRRIVYAGSLYDGYGPDAFFRLLESAVALRPDLDVVVDLYGKTEQARIPAPLRGRVRHRGYVSQSEAARAILDGDVALLLLPNADRGRLGWVPGKLYTYLALGRPILAIAPPGDAADILTASGGTTLVLDPTQPDGKRLAEWLADSTPPTPFDPAVVGRYDRRKLTSQLADVLLSASERGPSSSSF